MRFASPHFRRLLIAALALAALFFAWYQPIQNLANAQVDAGLKRALISFASARTLNAVISVVQGTELAVQPFGVGMTLTPGQVLDPINDLVEQFSSLMLVASVAFGIQKVLLAVAGHGFLSALVSGVVVGWAALAWLDRAPAWLSRLLLVLLMLRFAIPVVTLAGDLIFQQVLGAQYQEQQAALDLTARDVESQAPKPIAAAPAEPAGAMDKLREFASKAVPKLPSVSFDAIRKSVEQIPERLIKLIVIFLVQTIILPVLLLWALYRAMFGLVIAPAASPHVGWR